MVSHDIREIKVVFRVGLTVGACIFLVAFVTFVGSWLRPALSPGDLLFITKASLWLAGATLAGLFIFGTAVKVLVRQRSANVQMSSPSYDVQKARVWTRFIMLVFACGALVLHPSEF